MVVFSIKLLNSVRKAVAGRRYPHQLAGGLALGVLLGVIPHGNLLALAVLLVVLSFRVNHAMMGLVAILVTFCATYLDPYSHRLGEALLSRPDVHAWAMKAWALPMVPWTDLNNTVVLGSFLIGLAAAPPTFVLTLPLFRLIAPAEEQEGGAEEASPSDEASNGSVEGESLSHVQVTSPPAVESTLAAGVASASQTKEEAGPVANDPPATIRFDPAAASSSQDARRAGQDAAKSSSVQSDAAESEVPARLAARSQSSDPLPTNEQMVAAETRLDVIRMKDYVPDGSEGSVPGNASGRGNAEQPMDEALNYLLHQLRQSQQRKAAG